MKTFIRNKAAIFFPIFLLCSLTTCGGGGGGGDSGTQPPPPNTFSLSGTITAPEGADIDSDLNNPEAPYISNDSFDTAQVIQNPVIIGGYVNEAGAGDPGRSYSTGDDDDYFKVNLAANQIITLSIGDNVAGDLDLYLYDNNRIFVNSSVGVGKTESLIIATGGTYYVNVFANSGYSNYVLSIGLGATSTATESTLRVSDEFVPGEVIVRLADHISPQAFSDSLEYRAQSLGLLPKAGAPDREMLMSLGDKEQRLQAFSTLGVSSAAKLLEEKLASADQETRDKLETLYTIKELRKRKDIRYAEPNYILHALYTPNDQFYSYQWHYPLIHLPQAWDLTTGDGNVVVAVIDTGVLLDHPDLQGKLVPGYDFIKDPIKALDGDGIDSNPDDPGDGGGLIKSSFHGTHVAGTVAAATNNSIGVAGVAPEVKIMPIRVLGFRGNGDSWDIIQGVRYAAGLPNDSGSIPAKRADIINLSLGWYLYSQSSQDVYTQARNDGVIIVAAAGNHETDTPMYPASYNGVVSVSAVDMNKNLAPYSNFGAFIDVAAPGGDDSKDINGDGYLDGVCSTWGDDSSGSVRMGYTTYMQGTSMAAPHVAGVAALMKSVNPNLTPAQFDSLLASGQITDELGNTGRDDDFGHGLINAYKAVVAAGNLTPISPILVVSPSSLNFGANQTSLSLSVKNGGGGSLTILSIGDDANWLTGLPSAVDSNGLGTYTVTVNRSGLSAGTRTATITVVSSENTVTVPVIMEVSSIANPGNAGYQYVLLVNPDTFERVDGLGVTISNGFYDYGFSDVEEGNYLIIAGTDNNNDGYICDAGESCGAYLTLDMPLIIPVDSDLSGLDFSTGFSWGITEQASMNGSVNQLVIPRIQMFKRIER